MYFHAPCSAVLYSVMCFYIVECNCNFYEHMYKKRLAYNRIYSNNQSILLAESTTIFHKGDNYFELSINLCVKYEYS